MDKPKTQLDKMYDAYHAGFYTAKAKTEIAKNFRMAGFFPTTTVQDSDNITIVDVRDGKEFEEQLKGRKQKLRATGSSYRKVRATVKTPEGFTLENYGMALDIEQKHILNQKINPVDLIKEVGRVLAMDIDELVYNTVVNHAEDVSSKYNITANWTTDEIKTILADLTRLKNGKLAEGYNIDFLAMNMDAITAVEIASEAQKLRYEFPKNGFVLDKVFQLNDLTLGWGGIPMTGTELIGFCTDMPALEMIYLDYFNPNVGKVPSVENYEKYAPKVNVLTYSDAETEPEPLVHFKFDVSVGAYPIEEGKRLVKIPTVLASN